MDGTLGPGRQFGGYRIEALLGRGGMGVVYRAEQLTMGRRVALKVLVPELAGDEGFQQRFLRESRIAAQLDHPNVIPIYDTGEVDGRLFIAMRYVDGDDLHAVMRSSGRLEPGHTLALLRQVAGALDAAHDRGIVHRDVKPANIMVTPGIAAAVVPGQAPAAAGHVYLCDFGLGRRAEATSGITRTGQFLGTAAYVSPEQARGEPVDGRADAYALGCVLFQCLTGSAPFVRDTAVATIAAHLHAPVPAVSATRPELGTALDAVIGRALAKASGDRYPSCQALVAAAQEAIGKAAVGKDAVGKAAGAVGAATTPMPRSVTRPDRPAGAGTPVSPAAGRTPAPGRGARRWRTLRVPLALAVLTLAALAAWVLPLGTTGSQAGQDPDATTQAPATGAPTTTAGAPATTATTPATQEAAGSPAGAPSQDCVTGWTTPEPGTPSRVTPLDAVRAAIGVSGQFFVNDLRMFAGDGGVRRWYVRAAQVDDPTVRGRWLVERDPGGAARVVASAPYVSRDFDSGDWETFDGAGRNGRRYDGLPRNLRGCLSGA